METCLKYAVLDALGVLIVPCGMETAELAQCTFLSTLVLIVPCGMETQERAYTEFF